MEKLNETSINFFRQMDQVMERKDIWVIAWDSMKVGAYLWYPENKKMRKYESSS